MLYSVTSRLSDNRLNAGSHWPERLPAAVTLHSIQLNDSSIAGLERQRKLAVAAPTPTNAFYTTVQVLPWITTRTAPELWQNLAALAAGVTGQYEDGVSANALQTHRFRPYWVSVTARSAACHDAYKTLEQT